MFSQIDSQADRLEAIKLHPAVVSRQALDQLCGDLTRWLLTDLERAEQLAKSIRAIADLLGDPVSLARGLRAEAHVQHCKLRYRQAQGLYDQAVQNLEEAGEIKEAAITRSGALGNLIYLGDYDRARLWVSKSKRDFQQLGDDLRLARLQSNFGTLLGRQDRWPEALLCYREVHLYFSRQGQAHDAGIALRNIAVCQIMCGNFDEALAAYGEVQKHCLSTGLRRLALENEYNIAYLYFLRGEYVRAIRLYHEVRLRCLEERDDYHVALCDLDQAEIYFELNLIEEAEDLARRAYGRFRELEIPYESAKALTNLALILSRKGSRSEARSLLQEAHSIFVRENNHLWQALVDLYQGLLLLQESLPAEGLKLTQKTREFFSDSGLVNKTALCDLLLSELFLAAGEQREARSRCMRALQTLAGHNVPALEYRAYLVLGQIEEGAGREAKALGAYKKSQKHLERLCNHLPTEHLKIPFLEDKGQVYESLVWLTHRSRNATHSCQIELFKIVEQAKSRSLTDLLALRAHTFPPRSSQRGDLTEQVKTLRESLTWHYRQIDREGVSAERSISALEALQLKARKQEDELLRTLRKLAITDQEFSSLQSGDPVDLSTTRSSLSDGMILIQYFIARGTLFVGILDRSTVRFLSLASAHRVASLQRLLNLQVSKLRLPQSVIGKAQNVNLEATRDHLQALYRLLIAPIRQWLTPGNPLVVVPHRFLHHTPFHALHDGQSYMVDLFSISYAPSAGVFHFSKVKKKRSQEGALVLGVADDRAPHIIHEAESVASQLPKANLFLNSDATEDALRKYGPSCKYIHIATHGIFRRDNPMFSAIQLGTSRLSLFDLYHLPIGAELVVLSGCGTGLNSVIGAEEFVGLARGLLYSGARSALVTLWDVNDISTAQFMRSFYRYLESETSRSEALRLAMIQHRELWPHPYFWAPFVLVGDPGVEEQAVFDATVPTESQIAEEIQR